MEEIKKPLTDEDLEGLESVKGSAFDSLPARVLRYETAKSRGIENLAYIRRMQSPNNSHTEPNITTEKLLRVSSRLATCGNYLAFEHYLETGVVRLASARFCESHLLCPFCAIRRGSRKLNAYLERYEVIRRENPNHRLSLVTYTVKNGDDLGERFEHLTSSVKRLLDRRRSVIKGNRGNTEWAKFDGIVGSYEFTNIGNGWHPHLHMIVLHSDSFDYVKMQKEWKALTLDSHVLNVTPMNGNPQKDFLEVFKYALKFSDLSPKRNIEAYNTLSGKRLLFSAGKFWGVKVVDSLLDDLEETKEMETQIIFYKWFGGRYRLSDSPQ